jgi:hypothetical protein
VTVDKYYPTHHGNDESSAMGDDLPNVSTIGTSRTDATFYLDPDLETSSSLN